MSPAAHLEPENVIDSLNLSSIDQLLFHIAHLALELRGQRYGSFLEAANTAAKLSVAWPNSSAALSSLSFKVVVKASPCKC